MIGSWVYRYPDSQAAETYAPNTCVQDRPEGGTAMIKKIATWLVIAFIIFFLLTQPAQSAEAVKSVGNGLHHAADQLAQFFSNL